MPLRSCLPSSSLFATVDIHGRGGTHEGTYTDPLGRDTRPCQALEAAGSGATLLIHEATFENSLQSEAKFKQVRA
jgi:ribonuclease Z